MSDSTKLAVVTGASAGIGREIAVTLARHGWDVAFSHLGEQADAVETENLIRAVGRRTLSVRGDVGVKDDVWAFYASVENAFGRAPDVLVNNAGIQTWAPLLELAEADWDRVIRTNLKGCFLNTQRAAQRMIQHGIRGAIINIGSACNQIAFPRLVDYTASKGGIEQFTKVSALELGPHGIRVNCVAPGAIEHERTKTEAPDYAKHWGEITPLRRVGTTVDVAKAVHFLATAEADFITGQTLFVDGGAFSVPNWPASYAAR
ncbi:3-oxoacyl-[acyl-carrier-protein] reductase FabG [Lacunisphaera limnophila]|uniref:3-oxoacyl-[acyl-carrier-protein] reductase FabG n=1 Tax=Lacunisphaera limnophila TaxID=1838286 RepID=A0A1D8AWN2_9BACT|nr:SDR family oxidoreductase [Lacunisphaera limnophila]AOS45304.1 3-oxoacyl-[acyl-carrier-protein] reductase FabG [Lacunisphaera limnophila]